MAQSLTRALEGITFPCDRARLIEYARTNKASSKALSALEAIPHRNFSSMTDVLTAVPSKTEMRHRPTSPYEAPQPTKSRSTEAKPAEAARPEKAETRQPQSVQLEQFQEEAVEAGFPTLIHPPALTDQSAWLRVVAQWSASYLRGWRRLWSEWLR